MFTALNRPEIKAFRATRPSLPAAKLRTLPDRITGAVQVQIGRHGPPFPDRYGHSRPRLSLKRQSAGLTGRLNSGSLRFRTVIPTFSLPRLAITPMSASNLFVPLPLSSLGILQKTLAIPIPHERRGRHAPHQFQVAPTATPGSVTGRASPRNDV